MIQQLILDGVYMPPVSGDRYSCPEVPLTTQVEMISGRTVIEVRNAGGRYKVWKVSVSYDYIEDTTYRAALEVLRSGKPFHAVVLPDNSTEMVSSMFLVENLTPATFAFEDGGAVWRGLAFTLREVSPHA